MTLGQRAKHSSVFITPAGAETERAGLSSPQPPPSPLLQVVIKCWLTALFLRVSGCGGVLSAAAPRTARFGLMVSAASAAIHLSPGERVSHHHAQQRCAVLECHLPADSVTRKVLGSVWRRTKLGGSWGGDFIVCFFFLV